ncbi:hypothetical protein BJ912DRAFT_1043955 [Pholiota molesta]|nr:hypothetical protein BJ912DRAFT_1043955 [Pholiota molesta]
MNSDQHPRPVYMHMGTTNDFSRVLWPNARSAVSSAQTENDWFALGRPLKDEHYFAIGQMVLVRRSFTGASWRAATVIAPFMIEYEYGRKEERMYRVRLCDEDGTGEIAAYSPLRGEIRAMPLECPHQGTAHFPEPEARSHVNPYSFQDFIWATVCVRGTAKWVPAMYIKRRSRSCHSILILGGEREGQPYTTRQIRPYIG